MSSSFWYSTYLRSLSATSLFLDSSKPRERYASGMCTAIAVLIGRVVDFVFSPNRFFASVSASLASLLVSIASSGIAPSSIRISTCLPSELLRTPVSSIFIISSLPHALFHLAHVCRSASPSDMLNIGSVFFPSIIAYSCCWRPAVCGRVPNQKPSILLQFGPHGPETLDVPDDVASPSPSRFGSIPLSRRTESMSSNASMAVFRRPAAS